MGLTSDEENDGAATPPRAKKAKQDGNGKHRLQKYRPEWEHLTKDFGDDVGCWLTRDPTNVYKAKCKYCGLSVTANKRTIANHAETREHKKKKLNRESGNLLRFVVPDESGPAFVAKTKKVQRAEIKLSACLAAHNVPFLFMDHLLPTLKSALPDSEILKSVEMKRMKCTQVVTNVIGGEHKKSLIEKLREVKFSILTDESTHHNVKTAAVAVRFFDKDEGEHGRMVVRY